MLCGPSLLAPGLDRDTCSTEGLLFLHEIVPCWDFDTLSNYVLSNSQWRFYNTGNLGNCLGPNQDLGAPNESEMLKTHSYKFFQRAKQQHYHSAIFRDRL